MKSIAYDVFIPIFEKEKVTGYIIIERYARVNNENKHAPFYSNIERDQMLVFSNYMGNIINLLQTRSLSSIIQQEKQITALRAGFKQAINRLDFARSVIVKRSNLRVAEANFRASKKELRDIVKEFK